MRLYISASIRDTLKQVGSSKKGQSILKNVPWTLEELKQSIEKQFKLPGNEWMTWENQGVYRPEKWDDNDQNTWKWQLDHIVPHSTFNYTSMDCQEFRDCWSLNNLRPLSAKQNIMDGGSKITHKI
jgi:hypothetical protein